MSHESWIDRQIREATERGEFDNLPGAGKPLKGLDKPLDEDWWVKGLIEREKLPAPLPTSLALRKEVEDLPTTLRPLWQEEAVREHVEDLNARILEARRRPSSGPPVFVRTVDVDEAVEVWRTERDRRRSDRLEETRPRDSETKRPRRRWFRRR